MSQCGRCLNSCTIECRLICRRLRITLTPDTTFTSTSQRSTWRRKRRNTLRLLRPCSDQPASKFKHHSPITTLTRREIRSITFGSASTSAPKTKRIKKQHSPSAILNLTSATLLPICSIKKVEPFIVSFSQEDAVPMESIANTYTKSHPLKIVSPLIKPRIFLAGQDSAVLEKTWKELAHFRSRPKPCTLVTIGYQATKMEWLSFIKFCWGISHFGETFRTLTFCLIRDTLLSNMRIDAWLNLQSKLWLIKP